MLLKVPNHDFTILRRACKDPVQCWVPANGSDAMTLVEVGLTWLKLRGFLGVCNVLNQNFSAARDEQVFLVGIKLQRAHWSSIMYLLCP